MAKIIRKIINGILLAEAIVVAGLVGYTIIDKETKRDSLEYIIDTNRDKQFSPEEIKRFYDETKTSPYTKKLLREAPIEDVERFLEKYK